MLSWLFKCHRLYPSLFMFFSCPIYTEQLFSKAGWHGNCQTTDRCDRRGLGEFKTLFECMTSSREQVLDALGGSATGAWAGSQTLVAEA